MTLRRAVSARLGDELFTAERALPLLQAAWPLAVGARLAERTRPLALQGRMLLVQVPDARWRKSLHRMRREILARLAEVAGSRAPNAIGFVENAGAEPPAPAALPAALPEPKPVSADLARQAERIPDEELRARFLEAAARYLARTARGS